ncbi:hypothetical protein [Halorubrum sp. PV6]|uniref:hypothetical protein n=1 Tax=Halorubrum sp. PV6 TaxID=634157 RepID=UPI001304DB54|nr:hypothetical protein [Halorubrum sp. PV6]
MSTDRVNPPILVFAVPADVVVPLGDILGVPESRYLIAVSHNISAVGVRCLSGSVQIS